MAIIIYTNSLYHHGIKGQKWGVRHYQNADGTYTKEGLERYFGSHERTTKAHEKLHEARKTKNKAIIKSAKKAYKVAYKKEKESYKDLKKAKELDKIKKNFDKKGDINKGSISTMRKSYAKSTLKTIGTATVASAISYGLAKKYSSYWLTNKYGTYNIGKLLNGGTRAIGSAAIFGLAIKNSMNISRDKKNVRRVAMDEKRKKNKN